MQIRVLEYTEEAEEEVKDITTPFDGIIARLEAQIKSKAKEDVSARWWRRRKLEEVKLQREAYVQAVKNQLDRHPIC